jgi:NADH-quinone oxidoreductase subunit C
MSAGTATRAGADRLKEKFAAAVTAVTDFRDEIAVTVDRASLLAALTFCRDELGYSMLIDITTIDHSGSDPRFEIVYELYHLEQSDYLRLRSSAAEDDAEFPSAVSVWPAAEWHEREAYDMMGLRFTDHPDLRRILMWDGYPYFPLRKEFPLAGKPSEMPDVAFSGVAPLAGGPFVTSPSSASVVEREPRAKGES